MELPPATPSRHPVDVGTRTETIIAAELVFGFNHRYDLVLDIEGRFLRVQCKTGRLRGVAVHGVSRA